MMKEFSMISPTTVRTTMFDRGAGAPACADGCSSTDDRDGETGDGARGVGAGVRERRPDMRIGGP